MIFASFDLPRRTGPAKTPTPCFGEGNRHYFFNNNSIENDIFRCAPAFNARLERRKYPGRSNFFFRIFFFKRTPTFCYIIKKKTKLTVILLLSGKQCASVVLYEHRTLRKRNLAATAPRFESLLSLGRTRFEIVCIFF